MTHKLVVDLETTIFNKGNHNDPRNIVCCISYFDGTNAVAFRPGDEPSMQKFISVLEKADVVIGHNIKFDLHWLYRLHLGHILDQKRIRDTQVVEYILQAQSVRMPSLEWCADTNLGEHKLDVVKTQYWDLGIDTDQVPWEILAEYAVQDAVLTWRLFENQQKRLKPHQYALVSIDCQDVLSLREMESVGLRYNREKSLAMAKEKEEQIAKIQSELDLYHTFKDFNWSSNQHLSALLYGGTIIEKYKILEGVFGPKAAKAGQPKYRNATREFHFPQIFKPIPGSEVDKAGFWSVEEQYLRQLKGGKKDLLEGILQIKKLQKDVDTYLRGLPSKQDEGMYDKDYIFGTFNKTLTKTGRLSSAKPNLQNLSDSALLCFESRYAE